MAKSASLALCALSYLVATAIAVGVGYLLRDAHPLLMIAAADAAGTLVIFGFSVGFNNSSFYDPYWSVAPMVIVAYWAVSPQSQGLDPWRAGLVLVLVCVWGARLTFNWARGWQGLTHEDWRYIDLREQWGRGYWFISFTGIHFVPTVLVYLGCLALYPVYIAGARPLGWLDAAAAAVTLIAIGFEAVADQQLRRFVLSNPDPERILDTGLWAYSRHPNYFGEVLFWWGLYLFGLAAAPSYAWTAIGAGAIAVLFVIVSLPLIEKRMLKRRPGYAAHQKKVAILVPWWPKRP